MKINYLIRLGTILLFGTVLFPICSLAYQIQDLQLIGPAADDFVMGPGKSEIFVDPGQKITKEIFVTNRIGKTMEFKVSVEDFKGSRDPQSTVVLLGEERGPYSAKDYVKPEVDTFVLKYGERIHIPVEITIPLDAEPGGLYAAVLVRTNPEGLELETEAGKASGGVTIISRLGTLFFIRVKGEVKGEGFLQSFGTDKKFYEKSPVSFQMLFENDGSIHLSPYGIVEIKNMMGKKIDEVQLEPWFAMPDSLRLRKVDWKKDLLFGKYTATAKINRGYDNIIDEKTVSFWVIPWKIMLVALAGLIVIIWFLVWIVSHFELKTKKE